MNLTRPSFWLILMRMDEPLGIDESSQTSYFMMSFCISSDHLEPDSFTHQLGIQPTSVRLRGTPVRNGIMRRAEFDFHEWWFRKELRLSNGLLNPKQSEAFISEFLSQLTAVSETINALSEEHSVSVHLVYHMKYIPYIGLTRDHVRSVAALGATLDYDIMVDTEF